MGLAGEQEALKVFKGLPRKTEEERDESDEALAEVLEASKNSIAASCENALRLAGEETITTTNDWGLVTATGVDLKDFFDGKGFLNEETGNFQQDPARFKNNRDKFIYMGADPRYNDHYPTSEQSYAAGIAIDEMYTDESREQWFDQPTGFEECESNTAMCCWHRDRQYFDDNGNCNALDCANQNPGDNTDLCWTEHEGEIFPYPGSGTENALHCHGLAWGNDESGLDLNAKGKWNTLFYVSMYDHLKQRGYAEGIGADPKIMSNQAMCGCVEKMAPVARADCSELVGTVSYEASIIDGLIVIEHADDFQLEFQACEGFQYKANVTPDDFESNTVGDLGLKRQNNDLSAFVFRHWLEGKIRDDQVDTVEETLIGYTKPSVNKSDANRAVACEEAFKAKFPNDAYEEKEIE